MGDQLQCEEPGNRWCLPLNNWPTCARCGCKIPQFASLSADAEKKLRELISKDDRIQAIKELRGITGFSIAEAKNWVSHRQETPAQR